MDNIHAVIMAGGSGTRFWPMGRTNLPKQCLKIVSEKTMAEETIERIIPLIPADRIHISTNKFLAQKIGESVNGVNFVIEPMPKNTAAAIGLSALYIDSISHDAVVFVETTDHYYKDVKAYLEHINYAAGIAEKSNKIVLIGIRPTYPSTGFGYIRQGDLSRDDRIKTLTVAGFTEKPNLKTAEEYVKDGSYLWNSGMFIFKTSVMLKSMARHMPALHEGLMRIKDSGFDEAVIKDIFKGLEPISIDYGVMEKEIELLMVRGELHWDDIGDWAAMDRVHEKDDKGNVIKADHNGDAEGCIIFSSSARPIETSGIKDLIIIDTPDCTLVCSKDRAQNVRKVVEKLESGGDTVKYVEDFVDNPSPLTLSISSGGCDVKSDHVVALVSVNGLEVDAAGSSLAVRKIV